MKHAPVLAALIACCACGAPAPEPESDNAAWVGDMSTDGRVTTVINEAGSVWGGPAMLVEEASIGVEAGAQHEMLASIGAIAASTDEIYLLEQRPPVVRVFDLQGVHLRDIGREGQGPGELAAPFSLAVMPDGRLAVRDDGNARISFFSPAGELVDEWPMPGGFRTSRQMVVMEDGSIYSPRNTTDEETGERVRGMARMGPEGVTDELVVPPDFDYQRPQLPRAEGTMSSGARVITSPVVPYSPAVVAEMTPAGAQLVGLSDRYRFELRYLDGRILVVERVVAPVEMSAEESAWHRAFTTATTRSLQSEWSWSGPDVPSHKPFYQQLAADHSGRVWVVRYGQSTRTQDCDESPAPAPANEIARCWENTYTVDLFDVDGRYLGEIEMPPGSPLTLMRISYIRDDMAIFRVEDEMGTVMVKRYRLLPPGQQ